MDATGNHTEDNTTQKVQKEIGTKDYFGLAEAAGLPGYTFHSAALSVIAHLAAPMLYSLHQELAKSLATHYNSTLKEIEKFVRKTLIEKLMGQEEIIPDPEKTIVGVNCRWYQTKDIYEFTTDTTRILPNGKEVISPFHAYHLMGKMFQKVVAKFNEIKGTEEINEELIEWFRHQKKRLMSYSFQFLAEADSGEIKHFNFLTDESDPFPYKKRPARPRTSAQLADLGEYVKNANAEKIFFDVSYRTYEDTETAVKEAIAVLNDLKADGEPKIKELWESSEGFYTGTAEKVDVNDDTLVPNPIDTVVGVNIRWAQTKDYSDFTTDITRTLHGEVVISPFHAYHLMGDMLKKVVNKFYELKGTGEIDETLCRWFNHQIKRLMAYSFQFQQIVDGRPEAFQFSAAKVYKNTKKNARGPGYAIGANAELNYFLTQKYHFRALKAVVTETITNLNQKKKDLEPKIPDLEEWTAIGAADADIGMDSIAAKPNTVKFKKFTDEWYKKLREREGDEWSVLSEPNHRSTYIARHLGLGGYLPTGGVRGNPASIEGTVERTTAYIHWCNEACNAPPDISEESHIKAVQLALQGFLEYLMRNYNTTSGTRKTEKDRMTIIAAFSAEGSPEAWANVGEFVKLADNATLRDLYDNITHYERIFLG